LYRKVTHAFGFFFFFFLDKKDNKKFQLKEEKKYISKQIQTAMLNTSKKFSHELLQKE
jgi:hypothetical protein